MRRCSAQSSRIPTLRTMRDATRHPPIAPSSARFASATRPGSCSLPVGAGPPCHRKQGHKSKEAGPTVIDSKAPCEPSELDSLHMWMSAVIQLHTAVVVFWHYHPRGWVASHLSTASIRAVCLCALVRNRRGPEGDTLLAFNGCRHRWGRGGW